MRRIFVAGTIFCGCALIIPIRAQEVQVVREPTVQIMREAAVSSDQHVEEESAEDETVASAAVPPPPPASASISTRRDVAGSPVKPPTPKPAVTKPAPAKLTIEQMRRGGELAAERLKKEARAEQPPVPSAPPPTPAIKTTAATPRPVEKTLREPEPRFQLTNFSGQTAFIRLADGFDFPVGKPEAQGYYKARGFRSHGHLGEDWDGVGGGDTDLGDPIYSIGDGVVVFARDCHMGWGNVVIVRHVFREGGQTQNIDSLYGHLQKILVRPGQKVHRGDQIATLGNAHGLYDAHLHLEIRKNIEIGMSRAKFAQDYSNYYDPSQFILSHRHLQGGGRSYQVAMNTFAHDARIPWDKLRNYSHSHTGGGSSESAAALKKAVAAQSSH